MPFALFASQSPFNLNPLSKAFNRPGLSVSFNLNHLSMVFHFYCLLLSMSFTLNVSQLPFNAFHFHCIAMVLYFQRLSIALNSQCPSILFNLNVVQSPVNRLTMAFTLTRLLLSIAFISFPFHRIQSLSVSALLLLAEHVCLVPSSCITWLLLQSPYAQ